MPDSRVVFLDTSGWIALLNADDDLHRAATACLAELARQAAVLVTTD
jgi:predicted nucleic acid-binding protein